MHARLRHSSEVERLRNRPVASKGWTGTMRDTASAVHLDDFGIKGTEEVE